MKENVQRFGRFLSGMVMPNIAVFIAWGFITALFIPTGWMPNETLAQMVAPMQRFLLPTLIAYTGGKMVYDVRGGVVGAAAAIGILAGTEDPMFIGAMIAGPLGGWLMKKVDTLFEGKIPAGFEMLVNNFSAGILGALLAVFGCLAIEPLCVGIKDVLVVCVDFLVKRSLLPLTSLFVEPAKILFLNNAINHGVFTPLGMDQVAEAGKSIFFLIEANPGPGLGLLLAYSFFGKGAAKSSAPSAVIIHFLGGIHEIYFPYVLMNPLTVLAVMAGGMSGVFINSIFNSGLVSAASPGSIIAILGMCAKDSYIGVILSVIVAAAVSFVIAAFILKFSNKNTDDSALEEASAAVSSMKREPKGTKPAAAVSKIVFACDAGMGSSAMGATTLTKKLNAAGMQVTVEHYALDDVPKDTQVIVTHKSLVERARSHCPNALIFPITNFMGGKEYDEIVAELTK
ncbi:PTS mannitol transporter subunit IICBA [[Clostridium] innocuum]|nr:PTS mannitol transporter subunit IICBA [Erysipelotrichaceae bacterium]MCR0384134.1 PTS mannitol transporter subunit IICBA [[Clostridium] innocuum]MCR0414276.1 PTS mannitol transporter subunit IICBA [[Clostridium] innocuum]MCR0536464.1 PTS mannitol transporter subunit IICBA [[Clostridium] innocuum]MCR0540495.1 PTS mannitol transporter subunit IICBA [[Clostridium] innocuum]